MSAKRRQSSTKAGRDAAVFAAIASGAETHAAIADRLGLTRTHVTRVARDHRARIEASAEKTIQAAVEGPVKAREMAANATPRAIAVIIEIMDGAESPMDGVRLAAAKTILDRGGVPVRAELDAAIAGGGALIEIKLTEADVIDLARRGRP